MSNLLGGEIQLRSKVGEGSTFTLFLPQHYAGPARVVAKIAPGQIEPRPEHPARVRVEDSGPEINDDRASIRPGDAALLIIEDDPHYARLMLISRATRV